MNTNHNKEIKISAVELVKEITCDDLDDFAKKYGAVAQATSKLRKPLPIKPLNFKLNKIEGSHLATPGPYAFMNIASKSDALEDNLKTILRLSATPDCILQNAGKLIMTINAVDSEFQFNKVTKTYMMIIVYGIENKGKSTILTKLVGANIAYCNENEATKCAVYYNIFKDTSVKGLLFFWNMQSLGGVDLANGMSLDAFSRRMEEYMKDKNMKNEPLHVVMVSANPFFEGTVVDTPGWVNKGSTKDDREKKKLVMDILEDTVMKSHPESVLLAIEEMSVTPVTISSTIAEMIDYFEETKKFEVRDRILRRTVAIFNRLNAFFSLAGDSLNLTPNANVAITKRNFDDYFNGLRISDPDSQSASPADATTDEEEGFDDAKSDPSTVTSTYISAPTSGNLFRPLTCVAVGINNFKTGSKLTSEQFDSMMRACMEKNHIEGITMEGPSFLDIFQTNNIKIGLTEVFSLINVAQRNVVESLLQGLHQNLTTLHAEIEETTATPNIAMDAYHATVAVHESHKDTMESIVYGKTENNLEALHGVAIPDFHTRPKLSQVLFERIEGRTFFQETEGSKYRIGNLDIDSETSPARICRAIDDEIEKVIPNRSAPNFSSMNGKALVTHFLKEVLVVMLVFEYVAPNPDCVEMVHGGGRNDQNNARRSIEGIHAVVIADFKYFTLRLITYIRESMRWLMSRLVDISLIRMMNQQPHPRHYHLNLIDKDTSLLLYRHRLKTGYNYWTDGICSNMKSSIEHSYPALPEELLSLLFLELASFSGAERFISKDSADIIKKIIDQPGKAAERTKKIVGSLLDEGPSLEQFFNPKNAEYSAENGVMYAKLLYSTLATRFRIGNIPELKARMMNFSSNAMNDRLSIRNILSGFVFFRVAKVRMDPVELIDSLQVTVPELSDAYYVFNDDGKAQSEYLQEMYDWNNLKPSEGPSGQIKLKELLHVILRL